MKRCWVGPGVGLTTVIKRKILPSRESNPGLPTHTLVTILTQQSWFWNFLNTEWIPLNSNLVNTTVMPTLFSNWLSTYQLGKYIYVRAFFYISLHQLPTNGLPQKDIKILYTVLSQIFILIPNPQCPKTQRTKHGTCFCTRSNTNDGRCCVHTYRSSIFLPVLLRFLNSNFYSLYYVSA
jgi:hypothetical protein